MDYVKVIDRLTDRYSKALGGQPQPMSPLQQLQREIARRVSIPNGISTGRGQGAYAVPPPITRPTTPYS